VAVESTETPTPLPSETAGPTAEATPAPTVDPAPLEATPTPDPSPVPDPTSTPLPDPADVVHLVHMAPDQWQFLALALLLVVFSLGVIVAVKL